MSSFLSLVAARAVVNQCDTMIREREIAAERIARLKAEMARRNADDILWLRLSR